MAEFAKLDTAAATGLMVLLVVVTIIVMPIVVPLLATGVSVTFWDIASGLVFLMLIPLALSLFVRARYEDVAATLQPFTEEDMELLTPIIEEFCGYFNVPIEKIWEREITKIAPSSSRPYGAYYNPRSV